MRNIYKSWWLMKRLQPGSKFEWPAFTIVRHIFAPLDSFGSIPSATQFLLISAIYVVSLRTFLYFSGAVQYWADDIGGIGLRLHFIATVQRGMEPHIIRDLSAECTTTERVPFVDEYTIKVFECPYFALISASCFVPILSKVPGVKWQYSSFSGSYGVT